MSGEITIHLLLGDLLDGSPGLIHPITAITKYTFIHMHYNGCILKARP
jgi:hypothetical protein